MNSRIISAANAIKPLANHTQRLVQQFKFFVSARLTTQYKCHRAQIRTSSPSQTQEVKLSYDIKKSNSLGAKQFLQSLNKQIIKKIVEKDVNFSARDHLGRHVYDVLGTNPDAEIAQMLQGFERRQSLSNIISQKNIMYHALISSFRGEVILIKSPPFKNKDYYLSINPYDSCLKIFEDKVHYPQFAKELIPISLVTNFK